MSSSVYQASFSPGLRAAQIHLVTLQPENGKGCLGAEVTWQ
jgi:hypothetical protein